MTDEENKRFDTLEKFLELLGVRVMQQQALIIRMASHQQAHLAAIRKIAKTTGLDDPMLDQRLESVYQTAVTTLYKEFSELNQDGDVKKFLRLPDHPGDKN